MSRKLSNFRLPDITREQLEHIRKIGGYATATEVIIVALDRMALAFVAEDKDGVDEKK